MSYVERKLTDVPEFQSVCGPLHVLSSGEDSPVGSLALLAATMPGSRHYHRLTTEFYYISSGRGTILVDDDEVPVSEGSFLLIHPNTPHQVLPAEGHTLVLLVFSSPAWREDDEILLEEGQPVPQTG